MTGTKYPPCVDFNEYQGLARGTSVYTYEIIYPALGLAGEAGEVAEKIKKLIRDGDGLLNIPEDFRQAISKELGDVLWYVANLAADLDLTLGEVAEQNIAKLLDRKARGVIHGSGDDR